MPDRNKGRTKLTYSPDGRYLAEVVDLEGHRVYETSRYRTIGPNADSEASWADFDTENRLVITGSFEIGLYAAGKYSKPYLRRPPPERSTFRVGTFSPDGQSIVVSYGHPRSTRIDVVSAKTLAPVYSPNTEPSAIGHLIGVGWSPDGRYLFAQNYSESGASAVIRWSQGGARGLRDVSLRVRSLYRQPATR